MEESKKISINCKKKLLESIADDTGKIVSQVYGVTKILSYRRKETLQLKREDYKNNIFVKKTKKGYEITLKIMCSKNSHIVETINEVQKQVIYNLKKKYKIEVKSVNTLVCGLE